MTNMLHTIRNQARWQQLLRQHPCFFGAMLLAGMPLGVLLAVAFLTMAVTLPLAVLLGWL